MHSNNNIGRWSWKYAVVKFLAKTYFYGFYRRIYVTGRENIPDGGRLIFAANHQNALMDALSVILTNKYQPVYLARADIFKNPLIAKILRFLKIMPVYRFRDGVGSMGQNEDTFEKTSEVLDSGGCIGIMPEGNHGDQLRLRTLKKGIFRIAFKAVEIYGTSLDVKIIPVGLCFSNRTKLFEELFINYGKPLPISGYLDLYSQHPQKGINAMKNDLSDSMKSLIVDIKDHANYYNDKLLLDLGSPILRKKLSGLSSCSLNRFIVSKAFCQAMYEYFENDPVQAIALRSISGSLFELLEKNNIEPDSIEKLNTLSIFFTKTKISLCYPVFIVGFMLHIIPVAIIKKMLGNLKDPQFICSFKFVLGLFLIPLNYILLAVLFFLNLSPAVAALLMAAVPLSGYWAYTCYSNSQKLKNKIHFYNKFREDRPVADHILELRSQIIKEMEPVFQIAEIKLK